MTGKNHDGVESHIVKRYEIQKRLGKGVSKYLSNHGCYTYHIARILVI